MPLLVRACELTDWNEKQAEQYMYVVSGNGELGGGGHHGWDVDRSFFTFVIGLPPLCSALPGDTEAQQDFLVQRCTWSLPHESTWAPTSCCLPPPPRGIESSSL